MAPQCQFIISSCQGHEAPKISNSTSIYNSPPYSTTFQETNRGKKYRNGAEDETSAKSNSMRSNHKTTYFFSRQQLKYSMFNVFTITWVFYNKMTDESCFERKQNTSSAIKGEKYFLSHNSKSIYPNYI